MPRGSSGKFLRLGGGDAPVPLLPPDPGPGSASESRGGSVAEGSVQGAERVPGMGLNPAVAQSPFPVALSLSRCP